LLEDSATVHETVHEHNNNNVFVKNTLSNAPLLLDSRVRGRTQEFVKSLKPAFTKSTNNIKPAGGK